MNIPASDRKVIFLDIDGTLVPEHTSMIPQSAKDAIHRAQKNGHLVFVNTGRVWSNIDPFLREVGFDGFVCGCGTYISYQDQILLHHQTTPEVCRLIYDTAKEYRLDPLFEAEHGIYGEPETYLCEESAAFVTRMKTHYNIPTVDLDHFQFDKFVTWTPAGSDLTGFVSAISPYFDYINRSAVFSEFVPKGYSKATGIEFILSHFGLKHENTYAIGDGPNDLPMLEYVAHSIVMGNSKPDYMFSKGEHVTKDCLNDGIAYAFDHFILGENA